MSLMRSRPGPIWRLTLNRPEARNAVSSAMLDEIVRALSQAADDPACRVIIVSGAGKDFCAGADVDELLAARKEQGAVEYGQVFETTLGAIEACSRPVVAAVHGAALGAGCQIASACDLVVAAEDARFGIPSARLGIVVNYENVERLVLTVGPKRAADMLLAGRILTGVEAVEWGLANAAVRPDALEAATEDLGRRVASLAPLSVSASKRGIRSVLAGLAQQQHAEFDALADRALASGDLLEGLSAFRERRQPAFEGR
jgi:enoyl-CoA hydratase/carnithine racemase